MNVLVTGGAGFIGSHLVDALTREPEIERIVIVDNLSTGNMGNLPEASDSIELIIGDLQDQHTRNEALQDVEVIFHLAAIPSVPRSVSDPVRSHMDGAHATLLLLHDAVRAGIKRFIYSASSSAYGDAPKLPKVEDFVPDPRSPYAATKLAGEYYVKAFTRCYEMDGCSLRYFNIFGPRQDPSSPYSGVLAKFCTAYVEGEEITIHGDGEQSRDFTFVQNAVRANLLAMDCGVPLRGEVFNVGCGERITLNQTVLLLNRLYGQIKRPKYGPERLGDVKHSLADISRAREILGYEPTVGFEDGLRTTLDWYSPG